MKAYESDFTSFLREMRQRHPEWTQQQREGRALLWNKRVDFDELRRFTEANVAPSRFNYDPERIA